MVDVKVNWSSGNKLIVIHNDDTDDGPTVYTPEEAQEIYDQLGDIL